METLQTLRMILLSLFFSCIQISMAQSDTTVSRILPFFDDWGKQQGINIPYPFGISATYIFMSRDVEVTDVTVEFQEQAPQSIYDFSTFAVRNKTSVAAVKFDAWILPLLNVYILAGYAETDAKVNAEMTIQRLLDHRPPVQVSVESNTVVNGPYLGTGGSIAAGYGKWFILGDANYGETWPDELNNSVNFTFVSVRSGFMGSLGQENFIKAWFGAAYLYSRTTIEMNAISDVLGEITVRVHQNPLNPWTYHSGFMITLNNQFDFMFELGTNFDDASLSVLSATCRF